MKDMTELKGKFDEAMHNVYVTAVKEAKYNPHEFHRMLMKRGGVATAKDLINRTTPSDGYTNLYLRGFLCLTVEAVIFENRLWHPLFTSEELETCKQRLVQYQYKPASNGTVVEDQALLKPLVKAKCFPGVG